MPSPLGSLWVESTAVVANAQPDTLLQHLQRHPDLLCVAMPNTMTHRFVNDTKQAQRLFRRYGLCGRVLNREAHARGLVPRQ